ncbi:MAG: radical SAM family heme chaperone HemW [Hahellaceae bacterium]|nr:radical SAM family heme chaperone HemW [Hahellaceae bacterium]MCP5209657.1 radical SAM family heme chaperone HemW [Hahellaceae bacterium]
MIATLPPLSLYIHIPWCVRKCPYCDFNSHAPKSAIDEDSYLKQLLADLNTELPLVQGRRLVSIFIGGGTPSLMSPGFYHQLLQHIEKAVPFAKDIEITLESNPGTIDESHFPGYFDAGINRISLGVQSFNNAHLAALGRIHNGDQARIAVERLTQAGFRNFNIDLMHGLPDQTVAEAEQDLRQAIALQPTHLSWYQLTIEQNTEFYNNPPPLPADDLLVDIQEAGEALLAASGYQQYEVSAYSLAGCRSVHNTNYWQFGDYLAIGAGAHGKSTRPQGDILRYNKTRQPEAYLRRIDNFRAASDLIPANELPFEFMMNVLRLKEGVPSELFYARTGMPLTTIAPTLTRLRSKGLLHENRLQATEVGFRFLNETIASFLSAE